MISALRALLGVHLLGAAVSSSSSAGRASGEASIPEFGTPLVEGGRVDAMLAAGAPGTGAPASACLRDRDDLGIAKA